MSPSLIGRFAPSPTGRLHAGNIYASLMAWLVVHATGGEMVLRIEDLDPERSKSHYATTLQRDYEALGLGWDHGPFYQSTRTEAYQEAYEHLVDRCGVYPCFCTRADLAASAAPHFGEKHVYGGTCRRLSPEDAAAKLETGQQPAMRVKVPPQTIGFEDAFHGFYSQDLATQCGDFIVRRKDGAFAYQLAVVVDDAAQGVTSVTRGVDLLSSTPQQIFLQRVLGFPTPAYAHVPLLTSPGGRRLSKRDHDASLDDMLLRFGSHEAVLGHIAYIGGIQVEDAPATPEDLLAEFDVATLAQRYEGSISIPWL